MSIDNELFYLLRLHNKLTIKDFGSFEALNTQASIHPINHNFDPPNRKISFVYDENAKDYNYTLSNHLTKKLNISLDEANKLIESWVLEIKNNIQQSGKHVFESYGYLSINTEGIHCFEYSGDENLNNESFGMNSFNSPAVKREKAKNENRVVKKKRSKAWLVILIIFFVFAAGVTSTYFFLPDYYNKAISFAEEQYANAKGFFIKKEVKTETPKEKVAEPKTESKKKHNKTVEKDTINIESEKDTIATVIKEEINEKPVVITDKMYYIVAGSFKSKENAEKYLQDLKNASYKDAYMFPEARKGFYTVTYARFADKSVAQQELKSINAVEKTGAYIIYE